jgi:hypothetical protein
MTYDCYCDGDPPEFICERRVKARKPHHCDECGVTIQPGEEYETVVGKWDGSMGFHKTCIRCLELLVLWQHARGCLRDGATRLPRHPRYVHGIRTAKGRD